MKNRTLAILVVLVAFGFASTACGQAETDRQREKKNLHERLDPLLERSSKKELEAREFLRKKNFAAAETACREAIDILAPAPFAQEGGKSLMAEIYLAEERYKDALALWEPMYKPTSTDTPQSCWMAIALARANRPEDGATVLLNVWQHGDQLYYADLKDLPFSARPTPRNIEATALLFLMERHQSSQHPEEVLEWARSAVKLAPNNSATNYALASQLDWVEHNFKEAVPIYRKAYQHGGDKLKKYIKQRFDSFAEKLD